jgi:anti-sigma factor RsiW
MHDAWQERLSDYTDDGLDPAERASLEAHLEGCDSCRAVLRDLRRVRERARALPDRPPERDLWPGIETRILGARDVRRFSFTLPQLIAAGVALALLSGGAAWLLRLGPGVGSRTDRITGPAGRQALTAASGGSGSGSVPTESEYESAVSELKRALAAGRGKLDPTTVRTLESNLAIIELAIDQARHALESDPANPYVRDHLAETMRRKVELLRRATTLASSG